MTIYDSGDADRERRERRITAVAYALFALAVFGFLVPSIAGVVINYLKVKDAPALYANHHRWMIRTFWWGLLWLTIGVILVWVVVGYAVLTALVVWWIYRVIRGLLALHEAREVSAVDFLA